jgi:isopentenyl-diphosphate delta-isomerase
MVQVNEGMVIDVVDHADRPIGIIQRGMVFQEHASFRVAHTLVFNSHGELLIQQVASTRNRHPGYWGSSVAAYVFAGESYESAANRRLFEELGVRTVPLRYLGKTSMSDEGCFKFIAVFAGTSDGPFTFDHTHIEGLEFVSLSRLHELIETGSRRFTPTFLEVIRFYESKM